MTLRERVRVLRGDARQVKPAADTETQQESEPEPESAAGASAGGAAAPDACALLQWSDEAATALRCVLDTAEAEGAESEATVLEALLALPPVRG